MWCLHCERVYKNGEYRLEDDMTMCPYMDCDGYTHIDGWEWEEICKYNPGYPEVPLVGVIYPLYPKRDRRPWGMPGFG